MDGSGSVGVGGSWSISSMVNSLITVWKGIVFFVNRHICRRLQCDYEKLTLNCPYLA